MSILIKGMEMPKDGAYWCEIDVAGDIAMIIIHGENRKSFPLVPVPPHGKLIDADRLETDTEWNEYEDDFSSYSRSAILNAPTIIPAEEGEV